MSRNTKADVVAAAGRLFATRGYEGTSMRDLGSELGLLGSSLYSHVGSKQDLLVEVVGRGAELFQSSVDRALAMDGNARDRLRSMVAGHLDVVLDYRDEGRTFLNEARSLDGEHRNEILFARNTYEAAFRAVLEEGARDGSITMVVEPSIGAIFLLSIVNAVERWFREEGNLSRADLVEKVLEFSGI